jgi:peptidoglycan/LPS O-acetylase OafA/YrhL
VIALFMAAYVVKYPDVPVSAFLAIVALPFQISQPVDLWFVPHIHPYTSLFWTIAPAFQFYLLFPLILALVHARGPVVLAAIVACAIVLRLLLVLAGAPAQELAYFTLFGRIDQFMVGMGIALLYRAIPDRRLEILCPIGAIAMMFLLYAYNRAGGTGNPSLWQVLWPTAEAVVWGGFVLGYLFLAERLPGAVARVLASIGEVSFSMYLLHVTVISVALRLGPMTFGYGPFGAALLNGFLIVLPGAVALSWVSYRVIERPFLSLRVRYLGDPVTVHAPGKAMAT